MNVTPIRTEKVAPGAISLAALIGKNIEQLSENCVLAITSKVVSLCENQVADLNEITKEELVRQQAEYYTSAIGEYGFHFTMTKNTLIPSAGIDESNSDNHYVLWPEDPQKTANEVWSQIRQRYGLKNVGVVLTDSTCTPLRRGTTGIALAHCGFAALNNYVGKPDLFGRPFTVSQSNVAGGLAASAVAAMGEGSEQTPLCIINEIPFVRFQEHTPTDTELAELRVTAEEDIFAPFLAGVDWKKGLGRGNG